MAQGQKRAGSGSGVREDKRVRSGMREEKMAGSSSSKKGEKDGKQQWCEGRKEQEGAAV